MVSNRRTVLSPWLNNPNYNLQNAKITTVSNFPNTVGFTLEQFKPIQLIYGPRGFLYNRFLSKGHHSIEMPCNDKSCKLLIKKLQRQLETVKKEKLSTGVRYDLKTHLRVMKILALTIFGVLSSKMKLLNRYNLWWISYKLYQNDGFLTL